MIEKEAIIVGIAPDKTFILLLKNERGSYHESRIPCAAAIVDKIDAALEWLGKRVKIQVEKGEVEEIELVE